MVSRQAHVLKQEVGTFPGLRRRSPAGPTAVLADAKVAHGSTYPRGGRRVHRGPRRWRLQEGTGVEVGGGGMEEGVRQAGRGPQGGRVEVRETAEGVERGAVGAG